jgi:hypothetical protein
VNGIHAPRLQAPLHGVIDQASDHHQQNREQPGIDDQQTGEVELEVLEQQRRDGDGHHRANRDGAEHRVKLIHARHGPRLVIQACPEHHHTDRDDLDDEQPCVLAERGELDVGVQLSRFPANAIGTEKGAGDHHRICDD